MRVAIAGCEGRMGKALIREIVTSDTLRLTAASVSPTSQGYTTDMGTLAGIAPLARYPVRDLQEVVHEFDMLIDFTRPTATLSHVTLCKTYQKKMIIGTTGLDLSQTAEVKAASATIPIVFAPNMSIGLNVSLFLLEEVAKRVGATSDIHIAETHHRHKKDRPSGTSLQMEATLRKIVGEDKLIEHSSIRVGDIVGEHSVLFALPGEMITIKHNVTDRTIFARGALHAARWLADQPPGLYTMRDVLARSS